MIERISRLHTVVTGSCLTALLAFGLLVPWLALADLGDCGQPKSTGPAPSAADALETLRTAVGQSNCGGLDFCRCDVDSSGSVVAGDALRVLKKAVGQPLTLECPCLVTTTTTSTTTTTLHQVLTTELMVLTKIQGSYATSDLAGTWDTAGLASGPGAPWWTRGSIVVQSNGSFTGSTTGSDNSSENIAGKLALAANGILTCSQNCFPSFRGSVDPGKTVGVISNTWDDASSEVMVVTKRAAAYAQPDLAGTWALFSLESGPGAPWWSRGTVVVASNGAFDSNVVASDGDAGHISGTLTLSSSGRITCASSGCPASFRGAMDAGKTVAAITQTVNDGSTDLVILSKRAAAYSQSDLAGTWYANTLATGLAEPLWSRGTLTIAAGGALSGTLTGSNGSPRTADGTMLISSDGIVTNSGDDDFRCALDAGKSLLVCTDTW